MEKISLLLLFAKKTLIGTAIAGILGVGGFSNFFDNGTNEKSDSKKIEKQSTWGIPRDVRPRR